MLAGKQLEVELYPLQVCYVHMKLEKFYYDTTQLIPDVIDMETDTELPQYFIQSWQLKYMARGEHYLLELEECSNLYLSGNISRGLKMEIVFKRRLTNELLTTFLPSFLLLLITYATTYFKPFFFEAALTVNLTVMLVITTLFIRFISVLNRTVYILPF